MPPETAGGLQKFIRLWSRKARLLQVIALVIAGALLLALWLLRGTISGLQIIGYPGILFISMLSSASVLIPAPGLLSVCGLGLALNPIAVGVLAGIGETIGEVTGYTIGFGGQKIIEGNKFYAKVHGWMGRRGTLLLFAVSLIPNPIFDVVGIAAGAVRFPIVRFLTAVWAGKTLKDLMVAYACFQVAELIPLFD